MRINDIHEEFLNQTEAQSETSHLKFTAELGFPIVSQVWIQLVPGFTS